MIYLNRLTVFIGTYIYVFSTSIINKNSVYKKIQLISKCLFMSFLWEIFHIRLRVIRKFSLWNMFYIAMCIVNIVYIQFVSSYWWRLIKNLCVLGWTGKYTSRLNYSQHNGFVLAQFSQDGHHKISQVKYRKRNKLNSKFNYIEDTSCW